MRYSVDKHHGVCIRRHRGFGARFIGLAAALVLLFVTAPASMANDFDSQPASEILQDGLDALADNAPDLAREFFAELVTRFPRAPEARRGKAELSRLGGMASPAATIDQDGSAPTLWTAGSRLEEQRRAFLTDIGDRVFFAENSAGVGGRARAVLEAQAAWLKTHPDLLVTLIGRSDDGPPGGDASAALSQARVDAVRGVLIAAGVEPFRLLMDARGNRDPIALCKTALCQTQNRHVEALLSDPKNAEQASGVGDRVLESTERVRPSVAVGRRSQDR